MIKRHYISQALAILKIIVLHIAVMGLCQLLLYAHFVLASQPDPIGLGFREIFTSVLHVCGTILFCIKYYAQKRVIPAWLGWVVNIAGTIVALYLKYIINNAIIPDLWNLRG